MYSDSIIVDAVPQQTQRRSEKNDNYIKNNGKVPVVQVETQENQLSRQQVVHMLKNRFRNDFDEWQNRKDQRVSKTRLDPYIRFMIRMTTDYKQQTCVLKVDLRTYSNAN